MSPLVGTILVRTPALAQMFVVLWDRLAKTDPARLEYGVQNTKKTLAITVMTESFRSNLGFDSEPGSSLGSNSCASARWAPQGSETALTTRILRKRQGRGLGTCRVFDQACSSSTKVPSKFFGCKNSTGFPCAPIFGSPLPMMRAPSSFR